MQDIYTPRQVQATIPWLKDFAETMEAKKHMTPSGDLPIYATRKGESRFAALDFCEIPMKFGPRQIPTIKEAFPNVPIPMFEYGGRITARPEEFACFAMLTMCHGLSYSQVRFFMHYRFTKALWFQRRLNRGGGIPYDDKVEVGMLDSPEAFDREYDTLFQKFRNSQSAPCSVAERLYKEFEWYRSLITKLNNEVKE